MFAHEFSNRIVLVNGKYPRITCMRMQNAASSTLFLRFTHATHAENLTPPVAPWVGNLTEKNAPPLPSYPTHGLLGPVFFRRRGKHGGRELWVELLSVVSVPLFEVWTGFGRSLTTRNDE